MKYYKIIIIVTAAAFTYSFIQHLFNSGAVTDIGLQTSPATYFIARRVSVFPLGLAILLILSLNLPHSMARQNICISMCLLLLGYALIGGFEFITGEVNSMILIPVILEMVLGISFLVIFLNNLKVRTK